MKSYKNKLGEYHRTDGPAVESNSGYKEWCINGLKHRSWKNFQQEDGPAVEYSGGYKRWYLNGKEYSEDQYQEELIKIKLKRLINIWKRNIKTN